MILRIVFALSVTAFLFAEELKAQDFLVGALPTRYNGGFAGEAGGLRVTGFSYLNIGDYTYSGSADLPNGGTLISADHFLKKLRSGIAVTAGYEGLNDHQRTTSVSFAISPKFSFRGKYTIAPFVDFSFARNRYRDFTPKYSSRYWPISDFSLDFVRNDSKIKTGFLINSDKAYIGLSAEILQYANNPEGRNGEHTRFLSDVRYIFQLGYTFQRTPESKFSFTPQLVVFYNRNVFVPGYSLYEFFNDIFKFSLMFRYKKFLSGISDNGLVLGYQNNRLKLQITNLYGGITFNPDGTYRLHEALSFTNFSNAYAGSVSLRYIIRKNSSGKMRDF